MLEVHTSVLQTIVTPVLSNQSLKTSKVTTYRMQKPNKI